MYKQIEKYLSTSHTGVSYMGEYGRNGQGAVMTANTPSKAKGYNCEYIPLRAIIYRVEDGYFIFDVRKGLKLGGERYAESRAHALAMVPLEP